MCVLNGVDEVHGLPDSILAFPKALLAGGDAVGGFGVGAKGSVEHARPDFGQCVSHGDRPVVVELFWVMLFEE